MADISDVEQGFVNIAAVALYPSGNTGPSAVTAPCRVYRGWPVASALDADLAAGTVNVSVYPEPGTVRNSTRYSQDWRVIQDAVVSLSLTVSGNRVTVATTGAPAIQLIGLKFAGVPYVYRTTAIDTPASAASGLAALVPGASAIGAVITLPSADLVARVEGFAVVASELRRQWQRVRVVCWCSTPAQRDQVASAIDAAMAAYDGGFLPLPDGTGAFIKYRNSYSSDASAKDALWRRDLVYDVEFATVQTVSAPGMVWGDVNIAATPGSSVTFTA